MRAIVLEKFGGVDSLVYKEIPDPEPKAAHVVIEIKAFGINHAEIHMRRGEWAEAAPVSGIECVGLMKSCPGGEFPLGAKVAALMGGLGRTINGSYAEYTRAPVSNVALIKADLPWAVLAAIPETYATAWTCLFRNLEIEKGQLLVIRGATSSFGQAALNVSASRISFICRLRMSIAARRARSWPTVIRTRRMARRYAAIGRPHARAARSNLNIRQEPSGESRDGSASTCSKPCRSVWMRTRRRCACAARQSNIPSARSRCGWVRRTF
jgi:hypothetical protein